MLQGLLDTPILYLSRYINQNKSEYYGLLQAVRHQGAWEDWVLYILEGVSQTSHQTISLIDKVKKLMQEHKNRIRQDFPKVYSQDLLNNLFSHPYTKIPFVERDLRLHRNTVTKYLEQLVNAGILSKHRIGKENFYINDALFELFLNFGTRSVTLKNR